MTIFLLIGIVFVILWEMFHVRISLNSVLLQLLVHFLSGFRLELLYKSLIKNIRSSFIVCTNSTNPLTLKQSSGRLVNVAKVLLNLPNLHMLINKRVHHFPETRLLRTGKLLIVFSAKICYTSSIHWSRAVVFCI